MAEYEYALFHADRETEDDPTLCTIMYSSNGGADWYPMALCSSRDWGNEIVDALTFRELDRRSQALESQRRLLDEILRQRTECDCPGCDEGRP